jgi:hypothetical protein
MRQAMIHGRDLFENLMEGDEVEQGLLEKWWKKMKRK